MLATGEGASSRTAPRERQGLLLLQALSSRRQHSQSLGLSPSEVHVAGGVVGEAGGLPAEGPHSSLNRLECS